MDSTSEPAEESRRPGQTGNRQDFLEANVWSLMEPPPTHSESSPVEPSGLGTADHLQVGATIGRYRLQKVLGRGGNGIVFSAERLEPVTRSVAIKFLLGSNLLAGDTTRFERECQILSELDHPFVAKIIDSGMTDFGIPFLVMPLIDGEPINDFVARRNCGFVEVADILTRVCQAIEHAHERQTVHRDITPRNILVQRDGTPVVTDFGLARWADDAAPRTLTGVILGTPGYLAPEQCSSENTTGFEPTVDVYGIGATLYALLTGRPPFRESSLLATVTAIQRDTVESPRNLDSKIPEDLEVICLKCLQKNAADRFQTVGALRDDLQRFANDLPVRARKLPIHSQLTRWAQRNRTIASMTAAFATFGVASFVVVTLLWNSASTRYYEAEANLTIANETLHSLFQPINELVRTERDLAQNSELLESTLRLYEHVLERMPDDVTLRSEYATTWFQIADVQYKSGRIDESKRSRKRALSLFTDLAKDYPGEAGYQFSRFHCLYALGTITQEPSDLSKAHECIVELVTFHPENVDYLDAAAAASLELALQTPPDKPHQSVPLI